MNLLHDFNVTYFNILSFNKWIRWIILIVFSSTVCKIVFHRRCLRLNQDGRQTSVCDGSSHAVDSARAITTAVSEPTALILSIPVQRIAFILRALSQQMALRLIEPPRYMMPEVHNGQGQLVVWVLVKYICIDKLGTTRRGLEWAKTLRFYFYRRHIFKGKNLFVLFLH